MIPLNSFLIFYLTIYLIVTIFELSIEWLNSINIKKHTGMVPDMFSGWISPEAQKKACLYTIENTHLNIVQTLTGKIFLLILILSGILPRLSEHVQNLNFLLAGLIFFAFIGFLVIVFNIPFDYYHSFIIEDKYGFNTQTLKIWVSDLLKSILLTILIGSFLASTLLILIHFAGNTWWVWAWLVFIGFQLLMTIVFPTIIAPLFNKFIPLEDINLKHKIELSAKSWDVNIERVFQMDATNRTRHTNAYLAGLGKAKRIVLFDSMIQTHSHEEILAILAHEIGHLKKHHIKKHLLIITMTTLILFYSASKLMTWNSVYESFGFSTATPFAGLFLVGVLWEPLGFVIAPINNFISRHFERKADLYALKITQTAKPLISALKKMAKDNFSNLYPHAIYVWFNYSHPPIFERIQFLETVEQKLQTHQVSAALQNVLK